MTRPYLLILLLFALKANAQITSGPLVNRYAAIISYADCKNEFVVDDASGFGVGDTVLMIQMKGAVIDTTNTSAFGAINSYRGAGNHEFNVVKSVTGNSIILEYAVQQSYDIPDGRVQFVRVPSAQNHTVNSALTASGWNGSKGGVLTMIVHNTLTLNADIDVSEKGFVGGGVLKITGHTCNQTDYYYPANNLAACKGEGIANISASKMYGRGALANGGGGGNSHNSGGAGGGNGGLGGEGGDQYRLTGVCPTIVANIGGESGKALSNSTSPFKIFLGGGGGAGHTNEQTDKEGGYGGGIVLIVANNIVGNGHKILSNGGDVVECNGPTVGCANDGHSGGGAGGTIALRVANIQGSLNVNADGGKGADAWVFPSTIGTTGPGGGGGGGVVWYASSPGGSVVSSVNGGANGVSPQNGNTAWGATAGSVGKILNGFNIVYPQNLFVPGFPKADFAYQLQPCYNVHFTDKSTPVSKGIQTWAWDFGDGSTSSLQNPIHVYSSDGIYKVKLHVTDSSGCFDSVDKQVDVKFVPFADAGPDQSFCSGDELTLEASGGVGYKWTPTEFLSSPDSAKTEAQPTRTIRYSVIVTHSLGCTDTDSVLITFKGVSPLVNAMPDDTTVCQGTPVQMQVSGAITYTWNPTNNLSNPQSSSPTATVQLPTLYTVTGIDSNGCRGVDSVLINVFDPFSVLASANPPGYNCHETTIYFNATGADKYVWHPGYYFDDSTISNPSAIVSTPTVFTVEGISENGCVKVDTIKIAANYNTIVFVPDAFTPNNDGLNDKIKPLVICDFELEYFKVYNRWGENVFSTTNVNDGWDGLYGGSPADVGVFNYMVKGTGSNGKPIFVKGNFTLIR